MGSGAAGTEPPATQMPAPTEAHVPGSPRAVRPLAVQHPPLPELHGPTVTERELGEVLHPDVTETYTTLVWTVRSCRQHMPTGELLASRGHY